jgi:hypothetical protein
MKRSATTADLKEEEEEDEEDEEDEEEELQPPPLRRSTRSTKRDAVLERQRLEKKVELEKIRLQRAADLSATSLLQALPLVLTSGFLFKHEIRSAALASKSWKSIWVEAQHELPDYCQVEIKIRWYERSAWPTWVKIRGLQHVFHTQEFARTIFQKLCDLKIKVEPTERKKQKVRDALPKWGVDFQGIDILVWGPMSRNDGGMHIAFTKLDSIQKLVSGLSFPREKLRGWSIRLDSELVLWTWSHFQKWRKIYRGQPLWDCEIVSDFDDDDEEEMPPPVAAVAPPALPPPGRGRIDYYFQPRAL